MLTGDKITICMSSIGKEVEIRIAIGAMNIGQPVKAFQHFSGIIAESDEISNLTAHPICKTVWGTPLAAAFAPTLSELLGLECLCYSLPP